MSAAPARTPQVSVLMPAYNASRTVAEAVRSALAQSMCDLEVIVIDDGSEEPVLESLRAVGDDRLRIIRSARNQGVGAARNAGLAVARAPFVAQLDADDLWYPSHLAGMLPAFADPAVGLAYANVDVLGHPKGLDRWIPDGTYAASTSRSVGVRPDHPVDELSDLYEGNPVPSPTAVMRTSAVRAVGGYPEWLTVGEDYLLYVRLRRAGWHLAYVDQRCAAYRWPEPGRGASFGQRRHRRQGVKLFGFLLLTSPRDATVRRRLARELLGVIAEHVPISLAVWRLLRRSWHRMSRTHRSVG